MDFKTRIGYSLLTSFVLAILAFGFLNPIVSWYLNLVPTLFSCGGSGVSCDISDTILIFGVPIIGLFLCVASVFEVFLK